MKIKALLQQATQRLLARSSSARLDAELLLMKALSVTRSYLYAYSDTEVKESALVPFELNLQRRERGEPIAYILGEQEFYSMRFEVTPAVLIPRPETECLVDWILNQSWPNDANVIDLGTGSGAIALALAKAKPGWQVTAVDISPAALRVAQLNQEQHGLANVRFVQSHWLKGIASLTFHLMVANPPYIAPLDRHLSALTFEPQSALVAQEDGLADLFELLETSLPFLVRGGVLVLEHGYHQAEAVRDKALALDYVSAQTHLDLAGVPRFTVVIGP